MLKKLKQLGPGVMVAAAFIGPGTVTTATIAGASYGYTLLWAILFSIFATLLLQEMSARLGVIGKMGVGEAIRNKSGSKVLKWMSFILVAGAILVGNAAYEAGNITGAVLGFEALYDFSDYTFNPLIAIIGLVAFLLLFSGKFKLIEKSLVLLVSIMGVVFLVSAILLAPDFKEVVKGIFIPIIPDNSLIMIIGLIGTTVVPYNLFLHASSVKEKWKKDEDLSTSRLDTILSVTLGGVITMSILITSAIAFDSQSTSINSASDLAIQLNPILGSWSSLFIAFGFMAAGLSSSITAPLAAAYATSEIMGWKYNLKGRLFRFTWGFVLLMGIVFSSMGFKPTAVILFAQVANGLLLPIIAVFLLWIMNDRAIMKEHSNNKFINTLGIIVILITIVLGARGILSALGYL